MYALSVDDDGRVLSATFAEHASEGMPIVDKLPEGNITDYRYVDGEYVHDPLPAPGEEEPEASIEDVLNALLGVE